MRYSVQYYAASKEWFVIDSAVGIEIVGIYGSEDEANDHARKGEERWRKYGRAGETRLQPAA